MYNTLEREVIIMDKNSKKILKYLCKNKLNHYNLINLSKVFPDIPKDHLIEIVHSLYKEDHIKYVSDSSIKVTNKGITYISVVRNAWISEHIIETLALIVAFIALIVSIVALVRTF
jgi:hypothetical protein